MTNLQILKHLNDNPNCFSSLELCYKEGASIRLAVKSYSYDIIYNFLEKYPNVKKLLDSIIMPSTMEGILEYGISFDNDIIKIYYIDGVRVIGIDIKNDVVIRTKHYALIHDNYNIEVYEYNSNKNLVSNSVYEMYNSIDALPINEFKCFTDNCQYAYNRSKNQYYVRVYKEQFLYYYNSLIQLYSN